MDEQTDQLLFATVDVSPHHLNSSDYSGHVSQIKEVMRLGRCWPEITLSKLKDIYRRIYNFFQCLGCIDTHQALSANMEIDNFTEDSTHALFVKAGTCDDIEVPSKAWCDWIFTTSRRAHRSNDHKVRDFLQLVAFVSIIIPLSVIHPLS